MGAWRIFGTEGMTVEEQTWLSSQHRTQQHLDDCLPNVAPATASDLPGEPKAPFLGISLGKEGAWSQEVGGRVSTGSTAPSWHCHQGAQTEHEKHCQRWASHRSRVEKDWIRKVDIALG